MEPAGYRARSDYRHEEVDFRWAQVDPVGVSRGGRETTSDRQESCRFFHCQVGFRCWSCVLAMARRRSQELMGLVLLVLANPGVVGTAAAAAMDVARSAAKPRAHNRCRHRQFPHQPPRLVATLETPNSRDPL